MGQDVVAEMSSRNKFIIFASFYSQRTGWFTLPTRNSLIRKCLLQFLEFDSEILHIHTVENIETYMMFCYFLPVIGSSRVWGDLAKYHAILGPPKPAENQNTLIPRSFEILNSIDVQLFRLEKQESG